MSFLAQLQNKAKSLKPTVTVVRPHPCIQTGLESLGLSALGGAIEKEHVEKLETTIALAHETAHALLQAHHAVVYTGAGVSTSTGIADYRGPNGVWTSLATGRIPEEKFDITSASPSYSHMAIAKLVARGHVKFVTSTNLDGLHMKSGLVPLDNLSELHGSIFCERCPRCQKTVVRTFPVRRGGAKAAGATEHPRMTGRHCSCGGGFMDSGIDFGQPLPMKHLCMAEQHSKLCDFSLVVGSSMRVAPASELPFRHNVAKDNESKESNESNESKKENEPKPQNFIGLGPKASRTLPKCCIVNMMDTPKDHLASIRSYGKSDLFFYYLMKKMNLTVDVPPSWNTLMCTATEMKNKATQLLPVKERKKQYVGRATREKEMAIALFQVEMKMVAASAREEAQTESWKENKQ